MSLILALVLGTGVSLPAQGLTPEVKEKKLANGMRVLLVERPGTGEVHARLFIRRGKADLGALPPSASVLLARSLFGEPLAGELKNPGGLDDLLTQEEGAFEALRLQRLRESRHTVSEESPEMQGVETLQRQALDRIRELEAEARLGNPFQALGAVHPELRTEADYIAFGVDLPGANFESWCRLEADRLRILELARFPLERGRMLRELGEEKPGGAAYLSLLLGTALAGHPYAQAMDAPRAAVEALTWSDLRTYGRWAVSPERLNLVLVGDLTFAQALPGLERSFGQLAAGPEGLGRWDDLSPDVQEGIGARRLQASTTLETRLYIGWRVPAITHPDSAVIQILARILGGGSTSRLVRSVVAERGLARTLSVRLGVPGARDTNLLMIEAEPSEAHSLTEIEQAILGEVMRLQREPFQEGEIRRAQRLVELDQLLLQEDAASLAQALGAALCQGGDWSLAFRALQLHRDYSQEEVQAVARKYLVSAQATTVLLEPDPILMPQDYLERQLVNVLKRILEPKLGDPAQSELVVREALRQIRMLSLNEREQMLKMLEAQVKP